jgi:hypothetical protein
MYQWRYFTINSSISECDHKCETRNAEPEIGTDGSSQTRRNPRVDWYRSAFGSPRVSGTGFWMGLELNWPVFAVQTRTAGGLPGPVANTRWDHVTFSFAHQGCQYVDYGYQLANGIPMDILTRSKTVDPPLMISFRMWLLPCQFLFCL